MNNKSKEAYIKEQVGGKGYYACLSINADVVFSEKSSLNIIFSDNVENEWREAASVGVRTGWRCLPMKHKHGKSVTINIESIDTHPSDSSEIVVLYVAAKAVLELYDSSPPNAPSFVAEFGVFLFAK